MLKRSIGPTLTLDLTCLLWLTGVLMLIASLGPRGSFRPLGLIRASKVIVATVSVWQPKVCWGTNRVIGASTFLCPTCLLWPTDLGIEHQQGYWFRHAGLVNWLLGPTMALGLTGHFSPIRYFCKRLIRTKMPIGTSNLIGANGVFYAWLGLYALCFEYSVCR